ncbi:transposase family protein [Streptomyces sp. NPDC087866]|uniref:transposase n=1 Tax=unclassified Streptomyces TaxID=2593676 RepID=UPI00224C90CD|nr:transposase [Streptomyces sp. NBC_01789]MCX4444931.1 transposase [Streptomyces sp. NBC_01789]
MIRVVGNRTRAAIIRSQRITGLTPDVIAELVAELGPLWHVRHQAVLTSCPRRRAVGAGAKPKLVFIDRLPATLVHLRHATTHDVLACWFGVDRSTITRASGELRPLLAERGCTVAPDIRLRTLAEAIDGIEVRVRRPAAGRNDRKKVISGKNRQNAVKSMVVTDAAGRLLFFSPAELASCADIMHARKLGLVGLLADGPAVEILADADYQGQLAIPRTAPRTPRTHERHHPGRRRTALPPAGSYHGQRCGNVSTTAKPQPRARYRQLCTSSLARPVVRQEHVHAPLDQPLRQVQ